IRDFHVTGVQTCALPISQIDILTDKDKFKALCREHGIPVVDEYITDMPLDEKVYKKFRYPVLLKPADNSGGKGITICKSADEFRSEERRVGKEGRERGWE